MWGNVKYGEREGLIMGSKGEDFLKFLEELLELEGLGVHMPEFLKKLRGLLGESKLKEEISKLQELFIEKRPPRFAIVGRRGSGKSSLINAIFGSEVAKVGAVKSTTGAGKWYDYKSKKGTMLILDTRGLGEGSTPAEKSRKKTSEEEIKDSIAHKCPDAILFLCKAKEVDAHIDEDIESLSKMKSHVSKRHNYNPPIVGVLTQVDELDPVDIANPPYDDLEKQRNINHAKYLLSQKLKTMFNDVIEVIPTSAYMRFRDGEIVYDRRWNIDKLVEYLIERLPRSAQVELARISGIKSVQKRIATILIRSVATVAGLVGLEPIPGIGLPIITTLQITMIIGVGHISGRKMDKKAAVEFMTAMGFNVGGGFAFRKLASALVKLIPGGGVVAGIIAASTTWAIGKAAIAYFIDKKKAERIRQTYEKEKGGLPVEIKQEVKGTKK